MPRSSRWTAMVVVLTAALSIAPPAFAAPAPTYVALGDSYTAGPLILPQDPTNPGCFRSLLNYPHLLAAWYGVAASFRDVGCSGARTTDVFAPQSIAGGTNPAQLDAVQPGTKFVSLQFGGNDIGFSEIATNCVALVPAGTPCQMRYNPGGVDQISERIRQTAPKIDQVLAAVKAKAPGARIFLVGYPTLFPENSPGCWPVMPYAPDDVPYLVAKTRELNTMLSERARAANVNFVDTYTPSLGHDACAPLGVRWIEPVVLPALAFPVHPNTLGMIGMGVAVAGALYR